jgi:hypothetical protein
MTKKKNTHGGQRPGAGRHLIYGEETETISKRVPVSKKSIVIKAIDKMLEGWKIKVE